MKKLLNNFTTINNCISKNNFIFDNETYDEEEIRLLVKGRTRTGGGGYCNGRGGWGGGGGEGGGGGGGGGGMGGGGGGFRRLNYYGDSEMTSYIENKFYEDKFCIDYDDDLYKFNGFAKYKDMKEFIDYNFRDDIRRLFPNYASLIIGYISLPFLFALIIFSITRINYKDSPEKDFEGNSCCV